MEERYVTFQQAILLSEFGFDKKCSHYYLEDGCRFGRCFQEVLPKDKQVYECPTVQMAIEWITKRCLFFPELHLTLGDSVTNQYTIGVYEQTAIDTYRWVAWVNGIDYPDACKQFVDYVLLKIKERKEKKED